MKTKERFQMGEDEHIPCTVSGFSPARGKNDILEQNQHLYLQKLEQLHLDASFSEFRSMHMKLAWLANTFSDYQFEISQPTQVPRTATWPGSPRLAALSSKRQDKRPTCLPQGTYLSSGVSWRGRLFRRSGSFSFNHEAVRRAYPLSRNI